MTLEQLNHRLNELAAHKTALETQHKTCEQQLLMLVGHINEINHQIEMFLKESKQDELIKEREAVNEESIEEHA